MAFFFTLVHTKDSYTGNDGCTDFVVADPAAPVILFFAFRYYNRLGGIAVSLRRTFSASIVACGLAAALAILALDSTASADIVWTTAADISSLSGSAADSEVYTVGNAVFAYDWDYGVSGTPNVSINTVSFTGTRVESGVVGPHLSVSGFAASSGYIGAYFGYDAPPYSTLSASYENLLYGLVWGSADGDDEQSDERTSIRRPGVEQRHDSPFRGPVCHPHQRRSMSASLSANTTGTYGGVGQYSDRIFYRQRHIAVLQRWGTICRR